jgi:hypothetical protein
MAVGTHTGAHVVHSLAHAMHLYLKYTGKNAEVSIGQLQSEYLVHARPIETRRGTGEHLVTRSKHSP